MPSSFASLRSASLVALLASLATACAAADESAPAASDQGNENAAQSTAGTHPGAEPRAAGTLMGVHGMVLFGSGSERMYLSHIPLYSSPHSKQVIVEVKVDTGIPADQQLFATKQFTFNPRSAFSLGDLAAGTLSSVMGTVYLGAFESGGTPAFRNVKFSVQRVIFQRDLTHSMQVNPKLQYIATGTPNQPFLVHLIDAAPSFDQIVSVKDVMLADAALQTGTLVEIGNGTNSVTKRLKPDTNVGATFLGAADGTAGGTLGGAGAVRVILENSCMPGDQFFGDCPAAQ